MKMVLQKFIAQSGFCSRRKAEELIKGEKGRSPVQVNSKPAQIGMKVDENDDVRINGKRISLKKEKIYIMLNKPKGYVCTNRKFKGEKSVFELVNFNTPRPASVRGAPLERGFSDRLFVVGRLDKDSRGLVLLTNDGDLALKLTHPRYEHEKEYVVNAKCQISNVKLILEKLKQGVDIGEGEGVVRVKDVGYLSPNNFKIVLAEGKKRQIRRMFKILGCEVKDILRTRISKIELGNLKEGEWRYLSKSEIDKLSHC